MSINDVFRATATFTVPNATIAQWVWYYLQATTGVLDKVLLANIIEAGLDVAFNGIKADIGVNVAGATLELAQKLVGETQFNTIQTNDITSIVGTNGGDVLPQNAAPYVTFFTDIAKSRGKKFIFGTVEGMQADTSITAAFLAKMAQFGADFDVQHVVTGITYVPGNYNRPTDTFRAWDGVNIGVGIFCGSQYKRLPGRGV